MKTASTLLQGEVFPKVPDTAFHAYPSGFPHRASDLRRNHDHAALASLAADMRGWMARSDKGLQLFSWEGLVGDYLGNYADRAVMLDLMQAVAPDAHILLVIRKQADLANSLYKQALHRGHWPRVEAFLNYADGALGPFRAGAEANIAIASLDFDAAVQTYEGAFGAERVHVLAYEWLRADPDRFYAGLAAALGRSVTRPAPGKALNVGYNEASARLARRLNRLFRTPHNPRGILPYRPFEAAKLRAAPGSLRRKLLTLANAPFDPRWPLQGPLGARLKGSPDLIPPAARRTIETACAPSNAALDARRGLGLGQLGYY
ncbi:MAG: hypothetical protein ACK4GD_05875 [Sphingomonadaceae bacterium]